jgi:hypothetical protein
MHYPGSASAAVAFQSLKAAITAAVFIAVYSYLRWLPQPHSF